MQVTYRSRRRVSIFRTCPSLTRRRRTETTWLMLNCESKKIFCRLAPSLTKFGVYCGRLSYVLCGPDSPNFYSMMITQPVPNAGYKRSFLMSTRFWRPDSSRVPVSNGATISGTEHCFTRAQSSSIHDLRVCIMYTTEKDSGQSRFRRCEALSRHLVSRYLKIC